MEVWKCLEILRTSTTPWLFEKEKDQDRKLIALNTLSEIGTPSIIKDLLPLLKDGTQATRNGTIQTIAVLFGKLNGKKAYYNSLKYCSISKQDIPYFEAKLDTDKFSLLMKIASLNGNGYVREKAVRKLGQLQRADVLPFIIFRLADWVPKVRQVAKIALRNFIKPEFQQALIDNLSLFEWLQKVERTNLSEIYKEIIDFLVLKNRTETVKSFPTAKDKERRILAEELIKRIPSDEEIELLLKDKHFLIRLLTLNHFDRLTDQQKEKLLKDKSASVRQSTLYKFKDKEHFKAILKAYLADKSGSIRHLSRFYLKGEEIDFKAFYTKNLSAGIQVVGSLLGLLDIGAKDCDNFIEPYLENDKIRVVKTAFYVLSNLNPINAFNFAKVHLFTNQVGLRNQIIQYFGKYGNKDLLAIARNHYQDASEEIKLSMLKLFSRFGGYAVFPDLLFGTINESETIRNQARLYIQKWEREAISMFSKASEAEKERAIKVFNLVQEVHKEKKYFDKNPVDGLDFYIR